MSAPEGQTDGDSSTDSRFTRARARSERALERWGHVVYRHAWLTIGLCILVVGGLASQLPKLEIDTSTENFIRKDAPARIRYEAYRELFGSEDALIVAIRTDEVFDFAFLEKLRAIHEAFESEVPHLEDVTSLLNVRETRGVDDELRVDDFLEHWPETPEELAELRARALANPLYLDVLLSRDARLAAVMVEVAAFSSQGQLDDALLGFEDTESPQATPRVPLDGEQNSEIVLAVEDIIERFEAPDFEIHVAGRPVLKHHVNTAMLRDMGRFAWMSLLVIGVFLGVLFRSATAVILSLGTAGLGALSGFAFMAIAGYPLTSATQITPSFLLAVGVGNAVHLIAIFAQQRELGLDVESSLAYALGHSGLAIVMTGLTTAGSLLSFLGASLAIVSDFGAVAPVGVLITLVISLVMLPALMAVTPIRARARTGSALRQFPRACGALGARHPIAMVASWLLVFAASAVGISQLSVSNDPLGWFRDGDPLKIDMQVIDAELNGAESLELVVDSGRENGLYEPSLLRRIERAQAFAEAQPLAEGRGRVGRTTISIVQVVKEIHQALNANGADYYRLPEDRDLIAQELLLFENSGTDDLEDVVDSQLRRARISLKLPMLDAVYWIELFDRLESELGEIFGSEARFELTGQVILNTEAVYAMMSSLQRSYLLAFAFITPFMMLLLGSFRTGLLSMVPAVGAIVVTLGVMGWTGAPLESFNIVTGCIALGLAVDDTIHFMHNYMRARRAGATPADAIDSTLESTGQALLVTSLVLTAGFLIYTQAKLLLLLSFGVTTALAIALAFLANVTLAPALVTLLAQWQDRDGGG